MIITQQTIYMQIVCNGATELDRDPSEGPGPRITRIKSLEEETGGECLPHQNICCMLSYREYRSVFILFSPEIPEVNPQYLMVHFVSYLRSDLYQSPHFGIQTRRQEERIIID